MKEAKEAFIQYLKARGYKFNEEHVSVSRTHGFRAVIQERVNPDHFTQCSFSGKMSNVRLSLLDADNVSITDGLIMIF
jgi:hypothetical protein